MKTQTILTPLLLSAALLTAACSAELDTIGETDQAITNGVVDGDDHPAVVLILMEVGGVPAYRCSGTLIAPTVVLTAGHCVGEPGEFSGLRIFTESDVQNGDNDYPFAGNNTVEASSWAAHPEYSNSAFFLHDVGVINLESPIFLASGDYGQLPVADEYEGLKPGRRSGFTAVGYGLQQVNPAMATAEKVRMRANPHLIQINVPGMVGDFSFLLSNNASTGGTCFGDSGGPNFYKKTNVVAGVTSFGLNGTCGGTGGVFRLDRANVLAFIDSAID